MGSVKTDEDRFFLSDAEFEALPKQEQVAVIAEMMLETMPAEEVKRVLRERFGHKEIEES